MELYEARNLIARSMTSFEAKHHCRWPLSAKQNELLAAMLVGYLMAKGVPDLRT